MGANSESRASRPFLHAESGKICAALELTFLDSVDSTLAQTQGSRTAYQVRRTPLNGLADAAAASSVYARAWVSIGWIARRRLFAMTTRQRYLQLQEGQTRLRYSTDSPLFFR